MTTGLYNPLSYENLMSGLAMHLREVAKRPLSDALGQQPVIHGPGVYAIYYEGSMVLYESICVGQTPIYVGKAVPPGGRKGGGRPDTHKPALHRRLRDHAKSVQAAKNLCLDDFKYRSLPVEPVWIALAERFLIEDNDHLPVWNLVLDGFGKHDSGRARRGGERSWWDTLHAGRAWAMKERSTRTEQAARERVEDFFRNRRISESMIGTR